MRARAVLAVTLALLAGPALAADKAQPKDGGGSRSSGASARQPSSSGGGSWAKSGGSSKSSGGSSVSSSDRRESRPPTTAAQRRHPRPGTGTGVFRDDGYRGYRYGGRRHYSPRYSFGWYSRPYYYPYYYSPYYYGGYSPAYYGYGPYRRGYRDSGSLRIIVQPERTRVYVDGYYAGVADDFDGVFQRLNVSPGRHDISLRLEGYRTQHFKVYVPYDQTIKIHYDMVRGGGEATSEDYAGRPADDYARLEGEDDDDDDRWDRDEWGSDAGRDAGTVRFDVRPRGASVYVDGEFHGRQSTVRLAPGRHRIEIVHPGYRTVEREVDVRPGRTTEIEVELERN
jgi:hypothetical protein